MHHNFRLIPNQKKINPLFTKTKFISFFIYTHLKIHTTYIQQNFENFHFSSTNIPAILNYLKDESRSNPKTGRSSRIRGDLRTFRSGSLEARDKLLNYFRFNGSEREEEVKTEGDRRKKKRDKEKKREFLVTGVVH